MGKLYLDENKEKNKTGQSENVCDNTVEVPLSCDDVTEHPLMVLSNT